MPLDCADADLQRKWKGPLQYQDKESRSLMMLPTDSAHAIPELSMGIMCLTWHHLQAIKAVHAGFVLLTWLLLLPCSVAHLGQVRATALRLHAHAMHAAAFSNHIWLPCIMFNMRLPCCLCRKLKPYVQKYAKVCACSRISAAVPVWQAIPRQYGLSLEQHHSSTVVGTFATG